MNERFLYAALLAAAALGGCVTGIADDPSQAPTCANPLRGSRYALCGQLSSSEVGTAVVGGKRLLGTFDSTQRAVTNGQFTIKGGTFHAYR